MKIVLPEKVKYIIDTMEANGYEAYAVGGCVRDSILGRKPKDWDVTTNASPEEVKTLFRRTIDTGIEHGTVTVMLDKEGFEVTTYRIDGKYEDNRHPTEVTFTRNLEDDLLRRDFTINAMAYNDTKGVVDLFNGQEDLQNGIIRAVGDPVKRFSEDALRIMRAVRFSAVLGFDIEPETYEAMTKLSPNLAGISAERVREELVKLLMGKHPEKIHDAYKTGITKVVFPEWDDMEVTTQENKHHVYNCADHTIVAIKAMQCILGMDDWKNLKEYSLLDKKLRGQLEYISTPFDMQESPLEEMLEAINDKESDGLNKECERALLYDEKTRQTLILTMLLHDIAKPKCKTMEDGKAHFYGHQKMSRDMAVEILKRLKFDNDSIHDIQLLVLHHDDRFQMKWNIEMSTARREANKLGLELFKVLLTVQMSDQIAQAPAYYESGFKEMESMYDLFKQVIDEKQCFSLKDLAVGGKDLIKMGVKPGPALGEILDYLLDKVLENPELNQKEILLEMAEDRML